MISQTKIEDASGRIGEVYGVSQDEVSIIVRLPDNALVYVPLTLVTVKDHATYILPVRFSDLISSVIIPVVEERPRISKRLVEKNKIKIRKTVRETEKQVEQILKSEQYEIERRPSEQMRAEPAEIRYEGETMIIPVQEEVLVVEKRIRVREEIYVTKKWTQRTDAVSVRLRSEKVDVEHINNKRGNKWKEE